MGIFFTFIVIFEVVDYFRRNADRAYCFFSSLILFNILNLKLIQVSLN